MTPTLTREAIEKMEAGPEMDALVAEHVMGWTGWKRAEGDCLHGIPPNATGGDRHGTCVRSYSADIAAAWEVVERLTLLPQESKHYLETLVIETSGHSYAVGFKHQDYDTGWDWEIGWPLDSFADEEGTQPHPLPLLICRAALLATLP